jgi:hypothetical protein
MVGVRLSQEAGGLLHEIAPALGVGRAAVLEIAPQQFAGGKL